MGGGVCTVQRVARRSGERGAGRRRAEAASYVFVSNRLKTPIWKFDRAVCYLALYVV